MSSMQAARRVADAVRDEGYLLYPYRSTSSKNQVRWQFGVLGPPGAVAAGAGEEPRMAAQCLVRVVPGRSAAPALTVYLRFLQLQRRAVEAVTAEGFAPVDELRVAGSRVIGWDEAVVHEMPLGPFDLRSPRDGDALPVEVDAGSDVELLGAGDEVAGRVVRTRWALRAQVRISTEPLAPPAAARQRDRATGDLVRLRVEVENTGAPAAVADDAVRRSFLGAHLLLEAHDAGFVSLVDPPPDAVAAAADCRQDRCWPVLAGPAGADDVVLVSPIILEDHPRLAEQSPRDLFDCTEIDEILTLRVMTMTDEEKAQARATDPRAAEIIDRCSEMPPEDLMQLHGVLRDPHALDAPSGGAPPSAPDVPWWDPAVDASARAGADVVVVDGVPVSAGSRVRLHPRRRADAQDLFHDGRTARVTAVLGDVDGGTHVAVVVEDDPAADLHDWYGRYLYFAPDEVEPLPAEAPDQREESRP